MRAHVAQHGLAGAPRPRQRWQRSCQGAPRHLHRRAPRLGPAERADTLFFAATEKADAHTSEKRTPFKRVLGALPPPLAGGKTRPAPDADPRRVARVAAARVLARPHSSSSCSLLLPPPAGQRAARGSTGWGKCQKPPVSHARHDQHPAARHTPADPVRSQPLPPWPPAARRRRPQRAPRTHCGAASPTRSCSNPMTSVCATRARATRRRHRRRSTRSCLTCRTRNMACRPRRPPARPPRRSHTCTSISRTCASERYGNCTTTNTTEQREHGWQGALQGAGAWQWRNGPWRTARARRGGAPGARSAAAAVGSLGDNHVKTSRTKSAKRQGQTDRQTEREREEEQKKKKKRTEEEKEEKEETKKTIGLSCSFPASRCPISHPYFLVSPLFVFTRRLPSLSLSLSLSLSPSLSLALSPLFSQLQQKELFAPVHTISLHRQAVIVDFLTELQDAYTLRTSTLFLAVSLLRR